jgi:transposase
VLGPPTNGAAFQASGHTVRLIAPKLVKPYRMTGKRGKNDAAAAKQPASNFGRCLSHRRILPARTVEDALQGIQA